MTVKLRDLIAATLVRTAARHHIPLSQAQVRVLAGAAAEVLVTAQAETLPDGEPITQNMIALLVMVANGSSDEQIARRTGRSLQTVKSTMRRICLRLGAHNRAHAVGIATARELITGRQIWIPPGTPRLPAGRKRKEPVS